MAGNSQYAVSSALLSALASGKNTGPGTNSLDFDTGTARLEECGFVALRIRLSTQSLRLCGGNSVPHLEG